MQLMQLTLEDYETFAAQYQEQIKEIYGTAAAGSTLRKKHKGRDKKNKLTRTKLFESAAFKAFWEKLARKTDYTVAFDEAKVIERAIEALDSIRIEDYEAIIVSTRITGISADTITTTDGGTETATLRARFTATDIFEEISENTALSYPTTAAIVSRIGNLAAIARNPPRFIAHAVALIKDIELEEMLRTLSYHPTGE